MNNQRRDSRVGMIVSLGVLLAALWAVITYGVYREAQEEMKYDVRVRPGVVSYGTRSTASVPMVTMSPRRLSAPMVSAGAVRAYAHHGHATMPKASAGTGYRLHTTSSATVHSIGSGGGNGGGISGGGSSSSSSAGVSYGSVSVAMPVLAMATPVRSSYAASTVSSPQETASGTVASTPPVASSPKFGRGIRRFIDNGNGTYTGEYEGEWRDAGGGDWRYWDEWAGEWVEPSDGDTRSDGSGKVYKYVGTYPSGSWVLIEDQGDPTNPTPLGDMPWIWMILLLVVYIQVRKACHRRYHEI